MHPTVYFSPGRVAMRLTIAAAGGAELMLLGFISLLLSVFQGAAQKICVRESIMHHMLPCPLPPLPSAGAKYGAAAFTGVLGGARRLLAGGGATSDYCQRKVSAWFDLPCGIPGNRQITKFRDLLQGSNNAICA
jgi:hypothetical protein